MNTDDYLPAELPDDGALTPYAPGTEWLPELPQRTDYVPMVFGQPLPPGVTHEAAQQNLKALTDHFTQVAYQQRVPQHLMMTARAWLHQAAHGPTPRALAAHPYQFFGFNFAPADESWVQSFANAMWRVRAPEDVVKVFLRAYRDLADRLQQAQQPPQPPPQPSYGPTLDTISDREYQLVMARAESDKRAAKDELEMMWGNEFAPRLRAVQAYFAGLPAGERDYLNSAVVQGGVIAANCPEVIDRLYQQAMGPLPTGAALASEIASLEQRMRTDRRAWNHDEHAQLRLRELYRLRDGE